MKLQLLVPQYKETDDVIRTLLDSVRIQQGVDFSEIGVVIVNDGTDVKLSQELLSSYPFSIEYYQAEHRGVSATRNACLDYATADYVMFCDADDMFMNCCGVRILLDEMDRSDFDTLSSIFIEEYKDKDKNKLLYIPRKNDSVFVHGKVHKRKYLIENNIRWNERLTIHEDSYFNILCKTLTKNQKYCTNPFYLWKWRDDSICRHDDKYILKTYNNLLESNCALIEELINRNRDREAQMLTCSMVFNAYYTMNKDEWINQENKEFRDSTERFFKKCFLTYQAYWDSLSKQDKMITSNMIRQKKVFEGMGMEDVTISEWIKHIMEL